MALLTVNTGSSSLKLAVYDDEAAVRKAAMSLERIGSAGAEVRISSSSGESRMQVHGNDHSTAIDEILTRLPELFRSKISAIGHRLVHGGEDHLQPERITPALIDDVEKVQEIDRTHTPQALAVIRAVMRRFSDVPQFACFDTAFHRTMPQIAQRYPLPQWASEAGVRRYGFHGLSCESILSQLASLDPAAVAGRMLIAHLGNGASITAVRNGASIDTSMGFSATGGLMMGTRSGDLDPTVMTYLARTRGMTPDELDELVNKHSGLLGVSGVSQDMRDLLRNPAASDAIELYCYTARKHFGALAAALGGLDTIVFTGGIGEHAAPVREKICRGLEYLGVELDALRNTQYEAVISAVRSRVVVRDIAADENLVIARHVVRLLGDRST